jgi:serine/threonine protein kinase
VAEVQDAGKRRSQGRIGSVIKDKWRVDARIGSGGMAAVYAATHRNGNRVALKMLHMEMSRDATLRQRFLREGYVANQVAHPGAVRILDDDVAEDGCVFLVMELLEGESLESRRERLGGRLPMEEVFTVGDQLLDLLNAAHSKGIIHRDIKPENIFVTQEGQIKVLDFGIARLRDASDHERTSTGLMLGTPDFMSPEQASGAEVDARSDLWAAAATMFTLLSGEVVHIAATLRDHLIQTATQPARSLANVSPEVPPQVVAVIDRALQLDKINRFQDARAMQDAWRWAYRSVTSGTDAASVTMMAAPQSSPLGHVHGQDPEDERTDRDELDLERTQAEADEATLMNNPDDAESLRAIRDLRDRFPSSRREKPASERSDLQEDVLTAPRRPALRDLRAASERTPTRSYGEGDEDDETNPRGMAVSPDGPTVVPASPEDATGPVLSAVPSTAPLPHQGVGGLARLEPDPADGVMQTRVMAPPVNAPPPGWGHAGHADPNLTLPLGGQLPIGPHGMSAHGSGPHPAQGPMPPHFPNPNMASSNHRMSNSAHNMMSNSANNLYAGLRTTAPPTSTVPPGSDGQQFGASYARPLAPQPSRAGVIVLLVLLTLVAMVGAFALAGGFGNTRIPLHRSPQAGPAVDVHGTSSTTAATAPGRATPGPSASATVDPGAGAGAGNGASDSSGTH